MILVCYFSPFLNTIITTDKLKKKNISSYVVSQMVLGMKKQHFFMYSWSYWKEFYSFCLQNCFNNTHTKCGDNYRVTHTHTHKHSITKTCISTAADFSPSDPVKNSDKLAVSTKSTHTSVPNPVSFVHLFQKCPHSHRKWICSVNNLYT